MKNRFVTMTKISPIKIMISLFLVVFCCCYYNIVFAHGGGLDQSGGHNCYVGSCKGTYHYHQGGSSKSNFSWLFWLVVIGAGIYYYIKSNNKD